MEPVISVSGLRKVYASGYIALDGIDLEIRKGEIFALLGPNGAGKTTLISIVCGLVTPSAGRVLVAGHDIVRDYRAARAQIGLVPQELSTDMFETVWGAVSFSRGLFGKPRNDAVLEKILRDLSLWSKKDSKIMTLSGGMKRRLLIAKALAHEPEILFLDEPTAGVDVELRRDMWEMVRGLRERGTTIILTTHYLEEAEEMADRIAVIDKGRIKLVDDKEAILETLGRTELRITLADEIAALPGGLVDRGAILCEGGRVIAFSLSGDLRRDGVADLIKAVDAAALPFITLETRQSSLEDIFVDLLKEQT